MTSLTTGTSSDRNVNCCLVCENDIFLAMYMYFPLLQLRNTNIPDFYNNKYATIIKFRKHPLAADMNRKQTKN